MLLRAKKEELSEGSSVTDPDDPFEGMDPRQANQMMKELETSISGMDEDNPDPKQMGSLMRRMCEMSGEHMDEPMEEVVRKLEEGMNPQELEENIGDFMGDETGGDSEISGDNSVSVQIKLKRLLAKKNQRDPTLYDIRDFLKKD